MLNTLIFDLDNTLIDRNKAFRETICGWLGLQGHNEAACDSALDEIMQHDDWGYTDRAAFAQWVLNTYGNEESKKMTAIQMMDYMFHNIVQHFQPDPVLNALLQKAGKHYRLVVATNGGSVTQRGKLKQAQLLPFFQPADVFVSGEMGCEKPDPKFFQKIIDNLQLDPQSTMSIGDNPVNDIQAAAACGLLTCWVSYSRPLSNTIQPTKVIKDVLEISTWMQ